ncbi:ABC transporter ATP-binding protein [Luteolibacter flavescens]|uniref:ABC transporter ATP-binding protein n=1 Tax=Luteolibacter flavescens TaxID=1859460 RepID=A0ABT3FJZ8_9BACT|nr:ABC transporter ATP-binding protein [Luteolibacter flavescens]MCW1883888.1 ABC transporter ATP-binding protein [Luteolibacter flavescens]
MTDSPIIQARGVAKRFDDFEALAALDLEVKKGQCVGLLGPNGAGKSTFIGCLYGVVVRSGGELNVFGLDPATQARDIKRRIGVVPQENALDDGLTVLENMRIYASFGGLSRKVADPRIAELLSYMLLENKKDATIKTLSGGMKRRLTFVRALLADPELLILDEPTTGLDPSVRHLLWEKVIELRSRGKTILVTTHYMHEAEVLCDQIVILDRGKVVGTGAPRELIEREAPGFVGIFPAGVEEALKPHLAATWELFHQGQQCCVRAPRFDDLLELQRTSGVTALQLRPSNLEDVYLKLTGSELNDDE